MPSKQQHWMRGEHHLRCREAFLYFDGKIYLPLREGGDSSDFVAGRFFPLVIFFWSSLHRRIAEVKPALDLTFVLDIRVLGDALKPVVLFSSFRHLCRI